MLELTRPECLRLLAATGFGRIVISVPDWDHPIIRPVNYVFDEPSQSVLIRSSVIISGVADEITNAAELRRVEQLDLEPLAPGHKGRWICIRTNTVSGRRIEFISERATN